MKHNPKVSKSIQDKHTEIHYNDWYVKSRKQKDLIHINLQGKIKCKVLNSKISPLVCSKFMDKEGWPRNIDQSVCNKAECFVYRSIKKFQERKKN